MEAHCHAALCARSWRDIQACELGATLEVAHVVLLIALGLVFCGARALCRIAAVRAAERAAREPTEPDRRG